MYIVRIIITKCEYSSLGCTIPPEYHGSFRWSKSLYIPRGSSPKFPPSLHIQPKGILLCYYLPHIVRFLGQVSSRTVKVDEESVTESPISSPGVILYI